MSRRLLIPLLALLCPLLAPAAPVPKEMPAEMVRRLYGEVADKDAKVTCEGFGKDGLRLTVPKDVATAALVPARPGLVAQSVGRELEGDFVLTVRVRHVFDLPAVVDANRRVAQFKSGVEVLGVDGQAVARLRFNSASTLANSKQTAVLVARIAPGMFSADETALRGEAAGPLYLRLTRTGDEFVGECSGDGKAWEVVGTHAVTGVRNAVPVRVTMESRSCGEYTAEFDRYELKPLPAADDGKK